MVKPKNLEPHIYATDLLIKIFGKDPCIVFLVERARKAGRLDEMIAFLEEEQPDAKAFFRWANGPDPDSCEGGRLPPLEDEADDDWDPNWDGTF